VHKYDKMTLTAHSADSSPSSQALFTNMSSEVTTSKSDNVTALTPEMTFDREDAWNVAAYVSLFILSATLNSTVLTTLLCNNRSAKSHVNRFIIHLCTADLVVTFITMPLEVRLYYTELIKRNISQIDTTVKINFNYL
jgi:hypothetical protein